MTEGRFEIRKAFTFEAGHYFPGVPEGHPYGRIHGHSFHAEISLTGTPDAEKGWIADFGDIDAALEALKAELDHRMLNEIAGLETPSLENLSLWIASRLSGQFPKLTRVTVSRPSCGESCTYSLIR